MRLIMVKLLLFLLALLVAVILVAPQVDLAPILPVQQAGYMVALLLMLAVVTFSVPLRFLSALTARHTHNQSILPGCRASAFFSLRC